MACGPHLVRDGALCLNFEEEDFGQQDSTVISFFLPRWVETYEAARSFVALRDDTLILGTVSGTAYGYGKPEVSAGMTFGELAQLCLDLEVDHAYALDGGGSSSLVARINGQPRVLNTPTGGADVGKGEERYINTYWLVFTR
jgi:exopolysaccharide biosynthesis protein